MHRIKAGQNSGTKWNRNAGSLVLFKQFNGLLDRVGHAIRSSSYGHVTFQNTPLDIHHDATSFGQGSNCIIAPSTSNNGIKRIGIIFQKVIGRGHRGVEFSSLLQSFQQGSILWIAFVEFAMGQIPKWYIARGVVKFGIDIRGGHKDKFITHRYQKFHHQDKSTFHFVGRLVQFFRVPSLDTRTSQGTPFHAFGITQHFAAGTKEFSQTGIETHGLRLFNFITCLFQSRDQFFNVLQEIFQSFHTHLRNAVGILISSTVVRVTGDGLRHSIRHLPRALQNEFRYFLKNTTIGD
mmetsp:Transcript_29964/g.62622  ORF Transcript_29964/g.62622 Transcript_29964/m.62622 type:complete len:293 (+) Transcript_29964:1278-2156(+)